MKKIGYYAWILTRPKSVRAVGWKYNPWTTYVLKTTGQCAVLNSIFEDGTVSCFVWNDFFGPELGHGVFGIDPNDLEALT